jgi:hypothetical protein
LSGAKPGCGVAASVAVPGFRSAQSGYALFDSRIKKLPRIITLAENLRIMAALSQLRRLNSEERAEKESHKIRQMACIGKFS